MLHSSASFVCYENYAFQVGIYNGFLATKLICFWVSFQKKKFRRHEASNMGLQKDYFSP